MYPWRRDLKRRSRASRRWHRHPRQAFWHWTALGMAVIASIVTVLSVWSTTLTMRYDVRSLTYRLAPLHAQSGPASGGWRSALFPKNWTPVEDGVRLGVNVLEVAVGAPGKTLEDGTRLNVLQLRRPDGTPASVDLGAYQPYQFLHNFAYAGYHGGIEQLPPEAKPDCRQRGLRVFDVVHDYGCQPNLQPQAGGRDCRSAIQRAINAAQIDGGVVYFPPGEYVITTVDNAASLRISGSNVTLCGAGRDRTFLKVDGRLSSGSRCSEEGRTFCARHHQLVRAEPPSESANGWQQTTDVSAPVVKNEDFPTRRLTLAANPFAKNDEVVVTGQMTEAYRMEHDMVHPDGWPARRAYEFRRTVVGVAGNDIILDVPTRSRIRTYDEPTVAKLSRGHEGLREIGLENLSIGMVRHPQDWSTSDCPRNKDPKDCQEVRRDDGSFQFPAIRDIYDNKLIAFFNVRDSWLYQLTTYRPSENADEETYNEDGRRFNYPVEYLNMALYLENARLVSAKHLTLRGSQVDKGNHNGYAIQLQDTNEVLIEDVELRQVKKGFTFNGGGTSGNVIKDARHHDILDYQNDFHSYLSMANLIDGNLMDGNFWEAAVRPLEGTNHGHGTTQTVFWNTEGRKRPTIQTLNWDRDTPGLDSGIIVSNQFGWGYVIGTHGAFSDVVAAVKPNRRYKGEELHPRIWPVDWLEGISYDRLTESRFQGKPLEPASLYAAQLALRLGGAPPPPPAACAPNWTCTAPWSACSSSGEQTRTCTDSNTCGVTTDKPAERQRCTPLPPALAPTAAIGMNLNSINDWSPEWVFVDRMKNARAWIASNADGNTWASGVTVPMDVLGYPRQIPYDPDGAGPVAPQVVKTFLFLDIGTHYPKGTYTLIFDGSGEINLRFDASGTFSQTQSGVRHAVQIQNPSNSGVLLTITRSDPANPVKNIRFILPGFVDTYQTQPFHPRYLDYLKPFTTLRFMDWEETNNSPLQRWAERTTPRHMSQAGPQGVALEHIIDLCNTANKDCWLTIPHLANGEYIRQFATLVRNLLNDNLKVYIEYSNEVWNPQFEQYHWVQNNLTWSGLGHYRRYARLSQNVFNIFRSVFADNPTRVVRVLSGQVTNIWHLQEALKEINGATDAIAIAPYVGVFTDGLNAQTTSAEILTRMRAVIKDYRIPELIEHKKLADQYKIRLLAYEGGQHLLPPTSSDNDPVLGPFIRVQRDPDLYNVYREMLQPFFGNGGDLFMHFNLMGPWSKWGMWGALQWMDEDPLVLPKYRALAEWAGSPPSSLPLPLPPAACAPNWICPASWSACSSRGEQTRTCTDSNNCGVTTDKPAERQGCTPPPIPPPVVNQQPQVNAGADLTVTLPTTAALRGTVTDDGLPDPPRAVTLTWSLVSGPATVSFANRAAAVTTATFSAPGSYVLRLAATDSLLIGADELTVTVNPCAPSWTCPSWSASACTDGRQTRTCTDSNCGNPPRTESQACTVVEPFVGPTDAVSFTPRLQGTENQPTPADRSFTVVFQDPATHAEVARFTGTVKIPHGSLAVPLSLSLPAGAYDLLVHSPGYLQQRQTNVVLQPNSTIPLPELLAGNFNPESDHVINTLDWSYMNSHWNTDDALADFNRDGLVNTVDFSLLNTNWGKQGDK